MIVEKKPSFPWEHVFFECPKCHAHIRLEVSDLSRGAQPRQYLNGTWTTNPVQCEHCRSIVTLNEVRE